MHHSVVCHAPEHTGSVLKAETIHPDIGANLPAYNNGGPSAQPCMQRTIDMSSHARRIDTSPTMLLAQSSNVGMMQGMNGGMVKTETGYAANTAYMFGADGTVLDPRPSVRDATVSSFSSVESNSHPLNEAILDADTSFGFLGQIPRNFSLSDLTADFSSSTGLLSVSLSHAYTHRHRQTQSTHHMLASFPCELYWDDCSFGHKKIIRFLSFSGG